MLQQLLLESNLGLVTIKMMADESSLMIKLINFLLIKKIYTHKVQDQNKACIGDDADDMAMIR